MDSSNRSSSRRRSGWRQTLVVLACLQSGTTTTATSASHSSSRGASFAARRVTVSPLRIGNTLHELRGGATDKVPKKKKKKRTKSKKTTATTAVNNKSKIAEVLHEQDAAQALGDAIRSRGAQLRSDNTNNNNNNPATTAVDRSVSSVGWALGASDARLTAASASLIDHSEPDTGAGGVEAAPYSVLAHYFLKSHGGAHALQCVCSLLCTLAGLGAIMLPWASPAKLVLLKRCMLFAMIKHVSGLLATTLLTARAIPDVGFRKAQLWMQQLVTDPISQYVFYAACTMLWLPNAQQLPVEGEPPLLWWQAIAGVPTILVGPVVLREIISLVLVSSDVLVLWICGGVSSSSSSEGGSSDKNNHAGVKKLLKASQSVVNAVMSILVTPSVWRNADAAQRQAVLAKLTSKLSLAFEVLVGALFTVDAVKGIAAFSFQSVAQRPRILELAKRLLCTRLYLHFLWTRRRKITRLATTIRGGAAKFPMRVLDVLMAPQSSMGLATTATPAAPAVRIESKKEGEDGVIAARKWTWKDYAAVALGLDND